MEFVAFLEDLGDGICWVVIVCWESLDGHMVVMVKFTVSCDFFDSFFFQSVNQAFLHHLQSFFNVVCQTFNRECTLKVVQRRENRFCQVLATITLQVLTLFIGTALDILHFCMSAKVFVFELICTFICQVQFRLLRSCFFYRFHNFLFLDFFYFFIFYILGHFRLL